MEYSCGTAQMKRNFLLIIDYLMLCTIQHLPSFVLSGFEVAIAPNGPLQLSSPGAESVQGLQTFTNATGTPLLQYVQTSDGQQILIPSNQVVVQSKYPL